MEIRKITVGFEMENKNSTKAGAGRKVEKGNSVHRNLVPDNLAHTIRSREESLCYYTISSVISTKFFLLS